MDKWKNNAQFMYLYSHMWSEIWFDILLVRFAFHQGFVCSSLQEALTINKSPAMNGKLLDVKSCRIRPMFVLFHHSLLFFSFSVSYSLYCLFILLFIYLDVQVCCG